MADELNQTVDQGSMADDYMSMYEPDDDFNDYKEPSDDSTKPPTPEGGKDVKPPDGIPSGDNKPPDGTSPQPFTPPNIYGKDWYETGDDGNVIFNTEEALKFFAPKKDYEGFKPAEIKYAEPPASTEPPPDPYQEKVKAERERMDNVRNNLYMGLKLYKDAIGQGVSEDQAWAYAEGQIQRAIEKDREEAWLTSQAERDREYDLKIKEQNERYQLEARRRTNENAVVQRLGGGERGNKDYNELMAVAYPYMQQMYEMANPDGFNGKTQQEVKEGLENFYNKIASNMNTLNMFVEMAMNKVAVTHLPHMFERGRFNSGGQKTVTSGPSGLNPQGSRGNQSHSSLDSYLGRGDTLDAV